MMISPNGPSPVRLGPVALVFVMLMSVGVAGPRPNPASAARAIEEEHAVWRAPVDAPVVDGFRPPSNPYGAGNRGLEYATVPGQPVWAVADGVVVFAGTVGRHRFVVIAHSPGLRSTYAYLQRIDVAVGSRVAAGDQVAAAESGFHLTARLNGRYVDPRIYLSARWRVRLVAREPVWSGPH